MAIHITEPVKEMLEKNFKQEPWKLVKSRAMFLQKWAARCEQLQAEENDLHEQMAPHISKVLAGKRLLVLKEMLLELGYPDKELIRDIEKGFGLCGWLPRSHVFPPGAKRPTQSLESALRAAKGVNHSIIKQVTPSQEPGLDEEVWEQTEKEIEKGWVWLDESCTPEEHLLAKRFGLQQGAKTRLIDDCSIGGMNSACGTHEKLRIHSIDEMAAYLAWCLTNLEHRDLKDLVGKTYDLKSAYKQYAISTADRKRLRIAVWNPLLSKVSYLGSNALPFGAVASVSSFLRVSMAVWYVGVVGLSLCWTVFFDDYTLVSRAASAGSAAAAAELLFQVLGIDYAEEGDKSVDFGTRVKTLGVMLDLSPEQAQHTNLLHMTLGHTESRAAELSSTISGILEAGQMSFKEGERLRGRLQWFESFASGRIAQKSLRLSAT